jgi:hypothetical protein
VRYAAGAWRLKSEGKTALASGVVIPADWLDLLRPGLAMVIDDAEEEHADGKLSDDEHRECVERARWLAEAIGDVEPGGAYSVAPSYQETLRVGICQALGIQIFERERLTEYDHPGLRFIAERSETVLGRFVWELSGLLVKKEGKP